ncbi:hypothetical protein BRC76_08145 [Halobacteriales archaeon QH_8_67_36]|nr:MAG: hypothetical protein BRC76_08145 [Halobacteriales archaeon QH_8_67_36]
MVDAYKCQSCGTVVERPQSCPSCGEKGMRPTRVSESTLDEDDERAGNGPTNDEPTTSNEPEEAAATDSRPGDHSETGQSQADESGRSHRRERTASSGGLLAWLKSLF